MAPLIPKSMANQTITLKKYLGTDPNDIYNDSPLYETSTIENCIFQPQTIYTGTNNNREVVANAIVYLYAGVSTPFPTLTKANYSSKIEFEGNVYSLQTIVDNRDPFSNEVLSYELEVL
ncbi:MAG: putative minor capsid protein [Liquorilactobacillus ghanensis]|uniref:putative minor capsid protein n=1 Tax=Liquorilactobacillus ghanensis TaxID=399370 RepID=UPI0039E75F4F